jgi:hypothetical protein
MNPTTEHQHTESGEGHVARLLERWRDETAHWSSSTRITGHPAYQEIITLGPPALPALFRELERTRNGHLSAALAAITGARPVAEEDRGKVAKVAEAWLHWGRENGYQW